MAPAASSAAIPNLRFALEMAVDEEAERRALAGEVEILERGWREAEELAVTADDLLFPAHLRTRFCELRQAVSPGGRPGT